MAYTPDPRNDTKPADNEIAATAAAEFRTLKTLLNASLEQSLMEIGAAGNRVTEDQDAFDDWLTAALDYTTINEDGAGKVLDMQGRCFAFGSPWEPSGLPGLTLKNGGLFAVGTWSTANSLIEPGSDMAGFTLENVYMDGGNKCRLFAQSSPRQIIRNCFGVHYKVVGIDLNGTGADSGVEGGFFQQWMPGDSEYATPANFTAIGVRSGSLRNVIDGAVIRWNGGNIYQLASSQFLRVSNCAIYNTNAAVPSDAFARLFQNSSGAQGAYFTGNYFADGTIQLGDFQVEFQGNAVKIDNTGSTQTKFITLAGSASTITKLVSKNWFIQSDALLNGTIKFYDFTGTFAVGDYSGFETGNVFDLSPKIVHGKVTADGEPIMELYSCDTILDIEMRASNTTADPPPALKVRGNKTLIRYLYKEVVDITASGNSTPIYSGRVLRFKLSTALNFQLANDAEVGWFATVHHFSGTFTLTLTLESGASWNHISAVIDPVTSKGVGSTIDLVCVENTDGVSAVYGFIGDAQ